MVKEQVKREPFTTTLDSELLNWLRHYGIDHKIGVNVLLEQGITLLQESLGKSAKKKSVK